ncbi:hypothetical protein CYJ40_10720 [Brevibacterium ravenspurgense]|uniref:Tetratricopeptide repeat protein n=1 Tax=Brevibacterium ravenspurgense TaxID=479117 RepID=A0A2I1IE75_9MICO|nr:hypothetical protein [Brevibacterium ravenspurgense]PKY69432.1 hypothetical protein CYJ40_10720 [Brevibacterium ravenspurgense]
MANSSSHDGQRSERRPDRGSRFQRRDSGTERKNNRRDGRSWDGERRDGDRRKKWDGDRRRDGRSWDGERRDGGRRKKWDGKPRFKDNKRSDRRPKKRDDRPRFNAPPIPEGITGKELPGHVKSELRGLSAENSERTAKHIVAAGFLLDVDLDQAYEHAKAAARSAGRIGAAREALGLVAYHKGLYDEASRELRTHMRITGSKDNLAVIADAERGRGRPQKAIDMFADANRNDLSKDIWLELAIVAAGAHSDLGDLETARKTIEDVGFTGHKPASAIRLLQAYADLLRVSGDSETADKYDKLAQVTAERTGLTDASEEVDIIVIEEELEDEAADDKQTEEDPAEDEQAEEASDNAESATIELAEDVSADSDLRDAGTEKDEEAGPAVGDDKSEGAPADDGPVPVAEGNTLEDEINEEMAEIMADIDAAQEAESEDAEAKHQPSVDDEPEPGDTPPMFDL